MQIFNGVLLYKMAHITGDFYCVIVGGDISTDLNNCWTLYSLVDMPSLSLSTSLVDMPSLSLYALIELEHYEWHAQ